MPGKLIVLEGLDGSGKSTQLKALADNVRATGRNTHAISFPDYQNPSSALVQLYLNGEITPSPDGVNAYAASSFYAVDRYVSFQKFWKHLYLDASSVILADRYTTSNAIYQMAKLPQVDWSAYLEWLDNYEYEKLALPAPDLVVFLDMPPAVSQELLLKRYEGDQSRRDIHERDTEYLERCRLAALFAAEQKRWKVISCSESGQALDAFAISQKILTIVQGVLIHL